MVLPEGPALHGIRLAVRSWLREHGVDEVVVALSGGADSLALTAAAVAEASQVLAVVVDHGLQEGSDLVAASAAQTAREFGCRAAEVVTVNVSGSGGPEASARRARYAALDRARAGAPVLLGHTLDDQAETVVLGLGRGSGPRSIRGMASYDPPWGRPLLGVRRERTHAACAELGVAPWEDPHNSDPAYTRVRLRREVLPLLEDVLAGGVAEALARTAAQLREDGEVLDGWAADVLTAASRGSDLDFDDLDIGALEAVPSAVRRRVVRLWLLAGGATAVTAGQLQSVDDLVGRWRGQGEVAVAGRPEAGRDSAGRPEAGRDLFRLVVSRRHGRLTLGKSAAAL
ncbi:tRNA(Ile)-lysidine synthase [Rhodococcoides trifolii]|uniref:tRNA(Ile)-lysidine synthase n=1 Tax=Rhodococcoides trifolii TaxID=908250 RepID=A0A917G390_9NOCA|nr:tRNA lysidine(34) synthetase TilS [Rhodococcus trifolii]GGG20567.1 tRNA(Ile)-lysidine synthase [Rhodococcus trifolii]